MEAAEKERRRPTKKGTTPEAPPPPAPELDSRIVMLTEKSEIDEHVIDSHEILNKTQISQSIAPAPRVQAEAA